MNSTMIKQFVHFILVVVECMEACVGVKDALNTPYLFLIVMTLCDVFPAVYQSVSEEDDYVHCIIFHCHTTPYYTLPCHPTFCHTLLTLCHIFLHHTTSPYTLPHLPILCHFFLYPCHTLLHPATLPCTLPSCPIPCHGTEVRFVVSQDYVQKKPSLFQMTN